MDRLRDSGLLAGGVGALVLAVTVLLAGLPFVVGLALGVVAFAAVILLWRTDPAQQLLAEGVTRGQLELTLKEGGAKLARLERAAQSIAKPPVRGQVLEIVETGRRILRDFEQDPADLRQAGYVFSLVIDSTSVIVAKYAELAAKNVPSAQRTLDRIEGEVLPTLDAGFARLYDKLQANDVLDLDVTLATLRDTLSLEGIGPTS